MIAINQVCVIGAGTMGSGIAKVFAISGYKTLFYDADTEVATKAKERLISSIQKRVDAGKETIEKINKLENNIIVVELDKITNCGLVVEAIIEDKKIKQDLYKALESQLDTNSIIATNTSSMSITELGNQLSNKDRFLGMHFFNPADRMDLVEVVSGANSSSEVVDEIMQIAKQIGKTPVKVEENAGFVVNRILIPMINEAVCVLAEGTASKEDIDTAMKLGTNHPMGPLELGDLIGLDVCLAIMEVLSYETGDHKYRPHPLLRKMVRSGMLGRKTKQGFFNYN